MSEMAVGMDILPVYMSKMAVKMDMYVRSCRSSPTTNLADKGALHGGDNFTGPETNTVMWLVPATVHV